MNNDARRLRHVARDLGGRIARAPRPDRPVAEAVVATVAGLGVGVHATGPVFVPTLLGRVQGTELAGSAASVASDPDPVVVALLRGTVADGDRLLCELIDGYWCAEWEGHTGSCPTRVTVYVYACCDPIAGVTVTLKHADGTAYASAVTDATGAAVFDAIPLGDYQITGLADLPAGLEEEPGYFPHALTVGCGPITVTLQISESTAGIDGRHGLILSDGYICSCCGRTATGDPWCNLPMPDTATITLPGSIGDVALAAYNCSPSPDPRARSHGWGGKATVTVTGPAACLGGYYDTFELQLFIVANACGFSVVFLGDVLNRCRCPLTTDFWGNPLPDYSFCDFVRLSARGTYPFNNLCTLFSGLFLNALAPTGSTCDPPFFTCEVESFLSSGLAYFLFGPGPFTVTLIPA